MSTAKDLLSMNSPVEIKYDQDYTADDTTESHRRRFSYPEVYTNKELRNSTPIRKKQEVEQRQESIRENYSSAGSLYRNRGLSEKEEYSVQMKPSSMSVVSSKHPCSTSSSTRSHTPCEVV